MNLDIQGGSRVNTKSTAGWLRSESKSMALS